VAAAAFGATGTSPIKMLQKASHFYYENGQNEFFVRKLCVRFYICLDSLAVVRCAFDFLPIYRDGI
jgi:hypothetical protein